VPLLVALLAAAFLIIPTVAGAQSKLVSPQQIAPAPAPLPPPSPSLKEGEDRPPQTVPAPKSQESEHDRRGTADAPLIVEMRNAPKTDAEAAEEATEKQRKASADQWIIWLTAALVSATIMQFFALGYQGYWVRRTVKSAERSLAQIERALLVGAKVDTTGLVRNQRIIGHRITVLFTNTGRTPARRVTSNANFVVFDGEGVPSSFNYPDRTAAPPAYGILGPHIPLPIPIDVAIQDFIDIQNKRKLGLLYGWVEYSDIFEPNARRRTEFCTRIEVVGDPHFFSDRIGGPSMFGFAVYGPYNATDDECVHKPGEVPVAKPGELPQVTQPQRDLALT